MQSINQNEQLELLKLARESIRHGLDYQKPILINHDDFSARLQMVQASFVTLMLNQKLRGCIGTLSALHPLALDVVQNAYSAAFSDYRFNPLIPDEFSNLKISISLLSATEEIFFNSEPELLALIRPNIDGLVLEERGLRGTFLPIVWSSLPHPKQFLDNLKQKAGLPANYWSETIRCFRYTVQYLGDED